jgi:hypothetical protein
VIDSSIRFVVSAFPPRPAPDQCPRNSLPNREITEKTKAAVISWHKSPFKSISYEFSQDAAWTPQQRNFDASADAGNEPPEIAFAAASIGVVVSLVRRPDAPYRKINNNLLI